MSNVRRISAPQITLYELRHRPKYVVLLPSRSNKRALPAFMLVTLAVLVIAAFTGFILWQVFANALPDSAISPPIYPGAKRISTKQINSNTQEITYRTGSENSKVLAFYKERLTKDGWAEEMPSYGVTRYRWAPSSSSAGDTGSRCINISFIGYAKTEVKLTLNDCIFHIASETGTEPNAIPPLINITRKDYENALAKWKASGIEAYRISQDTFSFGGGSSELLVSNSGKEIEVINPQRRVDTIPEAEWTGYFKDSTVDGMFKSISDMLDSKQVLKSSAVAASGALHISYSIEFDPDFGYPVHLEGHPLPISGEYIFDADWTTTVSELRIIKRNGVTLGKP